MFEARPWGEFLLALIRTRGNLVRALLEALARRARDGGEPGSLRLGFGPTRVVLTADPALAREVLVEHADTAEKTAWERRVLAPGLGGGTIVLEAEEWEARRRAVAPVFAPDRIEELSDLTRAATRSRSVEWSRSGPPVDFSAEMLRIVNDVMYRFFLDDADTSRAHDRLSEIAERGLEMRVFRPPPFRHPGFRSALARITARIRDDVRTGPSRCPMHGVLATLGKRLGSDREVVEEVRSMAAAGMTTVHLMSWLGFLLAEHPDVQDRLRRDLSALDAETTLEALEGLPYLTAVIYEGLRLYPPAPFILRRDDARGLTFISIWAMHRHPGFWEEPERFRPGRWLDSSATGPARIRQSPAFMPFGLGPRTCIGRRFALTECRVVLAQILRRFRLAPTMARTPRPVMTVLTRPRRHVHVRAQRLAESDDPAREPSAEPSVSRGSTRARRDLDPDRVAEPT